MRIIIDSNTTDWELNQLLEGMVINLGCYWSSHFTEVLHKAQKAGLDQWESMGGRGYDVEYMNPYARKDYIKTKVKKGGSSEIMVWSGQTKAQATFAAGTAKIKMQSGKIAQDVYANPWTPASGEPGLSGNREPPFWSLNGAWGRQFFVPSSTGGGRYANLNEIPVEIWKAALPTTATVSQATTLLRIPGNTTSSIKAGSSVVTATWSDSKIVSGEVKGWH